MLSPIIQVANGADEANLSSKQLIRDEVRDNIPPTCPGGGKIRDGGDVVGDAVGFVTGELGTIYRHMLIVAARGLAPPLNPNEMVPSRSLKPGPSITIDMDLGSIDGLSGQRRNLARKISLG